jgi:hypothetical protein
VQRPRPKLLETFDRGALHRHLTLENLCLFGQIGERI